MRMEPADLLGHVQPVGENRDLLRETLLVDSDSACKLLHRLAQPIPLLDQPTRRTLRNAIHRTLDIEQPLLEERLETRALVAPHLVQSSHGALDDRGQFRGRTLDL